MKNRIAILLVAALFASAPLFSAEPPPPDELTQMTSKFFDLLKKDKIEQAYDEMLKTSKIKGKPEDVAQIKTQTREALTNFGPVLGFELLDFKRKGFSLMQLVYFSWHEERPLRWRFTFYRPKDKWRLVNIQLDDQAIQFWDQSSPQSASDDSK